MLAKTIAEKARICGYLSSGDRRAGKAIEAEITRAFAKFLAAELKPVRGTIADVLATERPFIGKASARDLEGLLALIDGEELDETKREK